MSTTLEKMLIGGSGNDILTGDDQDNLLSGSLGNDTLTGGAGNDTMTGGMGKDKYILKTGSGHDIITADISNKEDTLVLSDVKTLDEFKTLSSTQDGNDLTIALNDNDSVTIEGWYQEGTLGSIQLGNGQIFSYRPGTAGDDTLSGTTGSDIIMGGDGDDNIAGLAGKDAISAGDGNDTIVYDAADLMIDGGDGIDTLNASASKGAVTLDMTKAIKNFSNIENLVGGLSNDILTGDDQDNLLIGSLGKDTLTGGAGDDTLTGGMGKDKYILKTGSGHDIITADISNKEDTLVLSDVKTLDEFKTLSSTQDGNDLTIALNDNDSVTIEGWYQEGTLGSIQLGNGQVFGYRPGTAGDDILSGTAGSDIIMGGDGDDTIAGLAGKDAISAGDGNDTIVYDAADLMIDGGDGIDTLDASASKGAVRLDLTKAIKNFSNIENLIGGVGNDILTGDEQDNLLIGSLGNDTLTGGAGDDTLTGGMGKDKYILKTGSGHDTITADASNKEDTLVLSDVTTLDEFKTLSSTQDENDLTIVLNDNDSVTIEGWYQEGTLGSIQLGNGQVFGYRPGTAGDDILSGTAGSDIIMGGDGDDTIAGLAGKDAISAGDGNDTIVYDAADLMIDGGDGIDTLDASASKGAVNLDLTKTIKNFSNIENLMGGLSNDILTGDDQDNLLIGSLGNDTLTGGAGNDTLTGGTGKDKYILKTGSGHDTITADASNKEDTLVLSDVKTLDEFKALSSTQEGDDLTIALNGNDSVTIEGWYQEGTLGSIQLGNGQIFGYRPGTAGDDILSGTTGSDIIMGGDGDDNISGLAGKDAISAGDGNDTIVYDAGDLMIDGGDGIDTLDASAFKGAITLDLTGTKNNFTNMENLIGGLGNDALIGNDADNLLMGGAGNDRLVGNAGNDTLLGGAGADTYIFTEGFGSDVIAKDQYNNLDTIDISAFNEPDFDIIEEGQDLLLNFATGDNLRLEGYFDDNDSKVSQMKATVNGKVVTAGFQAGSDASEGFDGSVGSDYIEARGGDDTIYGLVGNDYLSGGAGNDTINGGEGDDEIWDDAGSNVMYGGKGNDKITADNGVLDNQLYGEDGNDTLEAWAGGDSLLDGGGGNDTLYLSGNGTMKGGVGNDTYIIGGLWNETGVGNIVIDNSVVQGDNGQDTLKIFDDRSDESWFKPSKEDFTYTMSGTDLLMTYQGDQGTITIKEWEKNSIEKLMFADGTILTAQQVKAFLPVPAGDMILTGDDDDNILTGDLGNDRLTGGNGNDTLLGGAGADTYVFAEGFGSDVIVKDQYNKLDTIDISAFNEPDFNTIEEGQDLVFAFGTGDNLRLEGYFDDNDSKVSQMKVNVDGQVITVGFQVGNNDNNILSGSGSSDFIDAGGGNDTIYGNIGNDYLGGGAGNDSIYGGDGDDEIWDDVGVNVMYGGKGNDTITADNGVADNKLYGEDGDDTLEAWAVGDTLLHGGAGNDTLYLSGNGTMKGGTGNDTYTIGGLWSSNVTGGPGSIIIDNSVGSGDNGLDIVKIFDDRSDYASFQPTKDDFDYTLDGNDLILTYKTDQSTITIKDWTTNPIETFEFVDGNLSAKQIESLLPEDQKPPVLGVPVNNTFIYDISKDKNIVIGASSQNSTMKLELRANLQGDWDWLSNAAPTAETIYADADQTVPKDLLLSFDSAHSIKLEGWFDQNPNYRLSNIAITLPAVGITLSYFIQMGQGTDKNEVIIGTGNDLTINGGGGDDAILGSENDETILGGIGNDMLFGNGGSDSMSGEAGNDMLFGSDGTDSMHGGDGDDILFSSLGNDVLTGGAGSDVYSIELQGGYNWEGYKSYDHTTITSDDHNTEDKVNIDLSSTWNWVSQYDSNGNYIGGYSQEIQPLDRIVVTHDNNDLVLSLKKEEYYQDSQDTTFLTIKDWQLGTGYQPIFNIDGDNYELIDDVFQKVSDTIIPSTAVHFTPTDNVETYEYTLGTGSVIIDKQLSNNKDTLKINIDPLKFIGLSDLKPSATKSDDGKDLLLSLDGNNKLVLQGWFENPLYQVRNLVLSIPGSNDFMGMSLDLKFAVITGTSVNNTITGTDIGELISGTDEGQYLLHGMGGNDIIHGSSGDDQIYGDTGDDILFSDRGNDRLYGGAGYDVLIGGKGQDILSGGTGNDVYMIGGDGQYQYWNNQGITMNGKIDLDMDTITADLDNHNDKIFMEYFSTDELSLKMDGNDLLIFNSSQNEYWDYNTQSMVTTNLEVDILKIENFGVGADYRPTFKFMSDNSTHTIDMINGPKWK